MPTYSATVYRGYEISVNLTRTNEKRFRIERVVVRHKLSTHSTRLRINDVSGRDFTASEHAFEVGIARAKVEIDMGLPRRRIGEPNYGQ
jgi:hypothetical protein